MLHFPALSPRIHAVRDVRKPEMRFEFRKQSVKEMGVFGLNGAAIRTKQVVLFPNSTATPAILSKMRLKS